jgi:hypothetical protein
MELTMQTHTTPAEIERRFSCTSTDTKKRVTSETIAQEIAEFEARGGKIEPIATGVSAFTGCGLSASNTIESLGVPVPKKPSTLPANPDELNLTAAANLLGMTVGVITRWIEAGELKILRLGNGRKREKFVSKAAVEKLQSEKKKKVAPETQEYLNLKQAAKMLGIHPTTFSKRLASGKLKIAQAEGIDTRFRLFKTSDVMSHINQQTEL